jgi:prevent-host-death family protein
MKRASITQAKNGLSALIERVRQGESIIIEDRGLPVAQLTPIVTRQSGPDPDRVARLERLGILRPPASREPGKLLKTPPPKTKRPVALSQAVRQDREEGW